MAWRYCALDNQPLKDNQAKINPKSQIASQIAKRNHHFKRRQRHGHLAGGVARHSGLEVRRG
jgi:hypothetical protein